MGVIDLVDVSFALPGGWTLFEGVTFRVPDGHHAALIGANGIGKSTLLRIVAGAERPSSGQVNAPGRVGLMRQFIGSDAQPSTVRAFLLRYAEPSVAAAGEALLRSEARLADDPDGDAQLAYAHALAAWEEAGGYAAEVVWDRCTHAAFGQGYPECADRHIETLSGGERKRLALEVLFRSAFDLLLLDEPDNFLDIDGKRWLEEQIRSCPRTILMVSHDRAVLAATVNRVVTLEGRGAWVHPAGFTSYGEAREHRLEKLEEEHRRFAERHKHLEDHLKEMKRKAAYNSDFASLARSAEKKLARFEERETPTERPKEQDVRIAIAGGRTGKMALRLTGLAIPGLLEPFDTEISFGERVGVIGPNGTGKTHLLRLLAGEDVRHDGEWRLGARVEPGLFRQLHDRPDLVGVPLVEVLQRRGMSMSEAMAMLSRYELSRVGRNPFDLLSGGQQARFQLLLMEVECPTMLLLDEPTDNLDVAAAEALEDAIQRYEGTVIAVTHDRWFMRLMDRFLWFAEDGAVREMLDSPWADEIVARP
jgi:ATPase subunit of ABC transporter with duplicated ATPase domains